MNFYIPDLMVYIIAVITIVVELIFLASLERKRKREESSKKDV
tara:strand:+ start:506 stop:634 length:129 start_codon:yes stop_codon:yes gene_type:complete